MAFKTKITPKWVFIIFFFLELIFVTQILNLNGLSNLKTEPQKEQYKKSAEAILNGCNKLSFRETCYAQQFYDLTKKTNIPYSIATLSELQKLDPRQSTGCHFIAHKITIAETEKDPSKWKDILKTLPTYACTGGYVHGVIEVHTAVDPNFKINENSVNLICSHDLEDRGFAETSCFHIMGHLMMAQNDGDIKKSVESCLPYKNETAKYECLTGTFMENETRENLALHEIAPHIPWNDETTLIQENICRQYSGEAARACWQEISHMYSTVYKNEPLDVFQACSRAPNKDFATACYLHAIGNMVVSSDFNDDNFNKACVMYLTTPSLYGQCTKQIVGALITSSSQNVSRAINACNDSSQEVKRDCFSHIVNTLINIKSPSITVQNACLKIKEKFKDIDCKETT
ncbi:MAG TPA: hypothetical protein VKC89_01070 [Patescibacteria group bacterium]|nr:hypothetical protein [Patescibacteria group bacterium]